MSERVRIVSASEWRARAERAEAEVERLRAVVEAARRMTSGIAVGVNRHGEITGTSMTTDLPERLAALRAALAALDAWETARREEAQP